MCRHICDWNIINCDVKTKETDYILYNNDANALSFQISHQILGNLVVQTVLARDPPTFFW